MKLLYDLLCVQQQGASKYHGGGEYGKTVFKKLTGETKSEIEIEVFYNMDKHIDDWVKELIIINNLRCHDVKNEDDLNNLIYQEKYEVLYSAMPSSYPNIEIPESCKYIGTIHDMRNLEIIYDSNMKYYKFYNDMSIKGLIYNLLIDTPIIRNYLIKKQFYKRKSYFENVIAKLDTIITVSQHSKYSMLYYLDKINSDSIEVFYTPAKNIETNMTASENKYGDYILIISANRYDKNAKRAIDAIEILYNKKMMDYKSIVVGGLPSKIVNRIENTNKFVFLEYVSNEELETLYKYAKIFVFPTLSEGFGMPPLEALKYGTKVAASSVTSVPEVCGNSVYYFNPYNVDEIAIRVLEALNSNREKPRDHYYDTLKRQDNDLDKLIYRIIRK